jgi:glutaredoxin-like protein
MHENREGQRVPDVVFRTRVNHDWKDVSSQELFAGRTVVVFALPGAFTPTCSSTHLPRYEALYDCFKRCGVDEIVCMSVNDAFVMDEWGKSQGVERVRLIPDGSGAFARGMGMLVNKDDLGFGDRSWRYSMLVRDGVVEKMFIEPDQPGDPFVVSDADTMLMHLDPQAVKPRAVTLFSKPGCPHCQRARSYLEAAGLRYEEIELGHGVSADTLAAVAGATSTPQIFIDGEHIGGADELASYLQEQKAA